MKILLVSDHFPPTKVGGVWGTVAALKERFEQRGHQVTVLCTGETQEDDQKNNIIRTGGGFVFAALRNNLVALKLIRSGEFEAINLHQTLSCLFLTLRPFVSFPRIVTTFHGTFFSEFSEVKTIKVKGRTFAPSKVEYIQKYLFAPIHIIFDFLSFLCSDLATTVSTEIAVELKQTYGKVSKTPVQMIPSGVELETKPKQAELPDLKRFCEGKTVILFSGVFRVRKRVFNTILAMEELLQDCPNVVLLLLGGGRGYEWRVKQLIEELNLQQQVHLIGSLPPSDVQSVMDQADILCLPSSREGLPLSLLEAMAASKACVTTNVSGMAECITDGKDGILVEVDDISALRAAMKKLVEDSALRNNIGEAARKRVEDKYSWEKIADAYLSAFSSEKQ